MPAQHRRLRCLLNCVANCVLVVGCGQPAKPSLPKQAKAAPKLVTTATAPTPAQRCSSTKTYKAVLETIEAASAGKSTLERPIEIADFSSPMVDSVDRDASLIMCSARLFVAAPTHHPSCAGPNYLYLDGAKPSGRNFSFNIHYSLHDAADGSGTEVSVEQGNVFEIATHTCVG